MHECDAMRSVRLRGFPPSFSCWFGYISVCITHIRTNYYEMLAVRSVEDGKGTDDDIEEWRWDGETDGRRRGEAELTNERSEEEMKGGRRDGERPACVRGLSVFLFFRC